MPTYVSETDSPELLVRAIVQNLTDRGYPYNPLTTSFSQYLASSLTSISGTTYSNKTTSQNALIAALVVALGGSTVSSLTTQPEDLMDLLANSTSGIILTPASPSIAENTAQGSAIGTLSVSGATGTASFTLVDNASNRVQLAGTNNVNVQTGSSAANYESATSFSFTVSVSGVTPSLSNRTFSVTVTDVNEASPVITSNGGGASASISVAENTTAVTTVTATDADGTAVITYSISGGADASKFQIGSSSGVLTFVSAPDYETPTDADTDNDYVVVVQASDGTNTDTQTITVTVTNVDEGGGGGAPTMQFDDAANSQLLAVLEDF